MSSVSSKNPHGLKVGQRLYFVSNSHHRDPSWWTITKIGKTWATVEGGNRVCLMDLRVDGGGCSSPGDVYLSEDDYEDHKKQLQLCRMIRDRLETWGGRPIPLLLTLEKVAELLDIKLESNARGFADPTGNLDTSG